MIVQESARGMTQVKRERESANDTHHAHSKTTGSRPGTPIDQNFILGVTTYFGQVHYVLKSCSTGKSVTLTDLGIFFSQFVSKLTALKTF